MSSVGPQDYFPLPPSSADHQSFPGAPPRPGPAVNDAHPQVPAVEPPAPVSERFRSRITRLRWWLDRGQELPSWMTSMVLHLAIIILFASLAVQAGPRPNALLVLDLSATMADQVDDNSSAIEIMPFEFSPLSALQEDSNTTFVLFEDHLTVPVEALTALADFSESKDGEPAHDAAESVADSEESPTDRLGPLPEVNADPYSDSPPPDLRGTPRAPGRGTTAPTTSAYDDIVERFIQYDIGNLPGEAGHRANREFSQLGADAIPALVRGLNQSARLQASCPVVVISSKLEQTMQQTNDRATIDYVLQNLGRDVPKTAPHAKRIESLREKLAKTFVDQQFYQDFTGVRPIANESRSQWVARVKRLYHADADELATALDDERSEERTAAWAAISMRQRPELTPTERMGLARILLDQWPRHSDSYRNRIHDALTMLAEGSGVAKDLPNFSRQQTNNTHSRWQLWWSEHGRTSPEVASAELMRLAKFANEITSQRLLARTVEKFPGTRNAELARHMLAPNAKLTLAQGFEKQSRWAEAIRLYEEIATDFPDSQHAPTAQQRLDVIGRFREPERASSE